MTLLKQLLDTVQLLGESNTPLPFRKVRDSSNETLYVFEYSGIHWFVDFQKNEIGQQLGITVAEITFYENPDNNLVFDTTGKLSYSGSVFGTVAAVVLDALASIDALVFIGASDRVSLYKKLVRRFASTHNTYRFDEPSGSLWVISNEPLQPELQAVIKQHSANIITNKT